MLQLLIRVVDAELLKWIGVEDFKAEDIQYTDELGLDGVAAWGRGIVVKVSRYWLINLLNDPGE